MNVSEYISLVNHADAVTDAKTEELERIIQDFPYLQSARALHLKGLYNQNSFKYNYTLKITAAHTADRAVLFDFITSDNFISIQNEQHDQKLGGLWNVPAIVEAIPAEPEETSLITEQAANEMPAGSDETTFVPEEPEPQPDSIITLSSEDSNVVTRDGSDIGRPLQFREGEVHSFAEWLHLSKFQPIDRSQDEPLSVSADDSEKQKKNDLIDRFIEANPKMPKVHGEPPAENPAVMDPVSPDSALMTETLARVYLEQKKYKKAIQAYEILILKYPEKSGFFADRISDIKDLQQNSNL